jgi:hypothetical protein
MAMVKPAKATERVEQLLQLQTNPMLALICKDLGIDIKQLSLQQPLSGSRGPSASPQRGAGRTQTGRAAHGTLALTSGAAAFFDDMKGAQLCYRNTLAGISEVYHTNKEFLIDSETVGWWGELHWNHRTLLASYYCWRSQGKNLRAIRMGRLALARWSMRELSAGFQRWLEWMQDLRAQEAALRRSMLRWRNQKLAAGALSARDKLHE